MASQFDSLDFHNPLENVHSVLMGLSKEISELRDGLTSEQRIRANEVNALRKALEDEKAQLPIRIADLTKEMADWKKTHTHRFEKVEHRLSELDMEVGGRLDRLETKLDSEMAERLYSVSELVKKAHTDSSQWKGLYGSIEKTIADMKRGLEETSLVQAQRHDQSKMEIDKIAGLLRENTLAKSTFEHIRGPSTPKRSSTPTTASPGSRNYAHMSMSPSHLSSPSHAFVTSSLVPLNDGDASSGHGRMKIRMAGLQ